MPWTPATPITDGAPSGDLPFRPSPRSGPWRLAATPTRPRRAPRPARLAASGSAHLPPARRHRPAGGGPPSRSSPGTANRATTRAGRGVVRHRAGRGLRLLTGVRGRLVPRRSRWPADGLGRGRSFHRAPRAGPGGGPGPPAPSPPVPSPEPRACYREARLTTCATWTCPASSRAHRHEGPEMARQLATSTGEFFELVSPGLPCASAPRGPPRRLSQPPPRQPDLHRRPAGHPWGSSTVTKTHQVAVITDRFAEFARAEKLFEPVAGGVKYIFPSNHLARPLTRLHVELLLQGGPRQHRHRSTRDLPLRRWSGRLLGYYEVGGLNVIDGILRKAGGVLKTFPVSGTESLDELRNGGGRSRPPAPPVPEGVQPPDQARVRCSSRTPARATSSCWPVLLTRRPRPR